MTRNLADAEIEAMKARVEEKLEDAEAAHRAYVAWMINWRIRLAALSESGRVGA